MTRSAEHDGSEDEQPDDDQPKDERVDAGDERVDAGDERSDTKEEAGGEDNQPKVAKDERVDTGDEQPEDEKPEDENSDTDEGGGDDDDASHDRRRLAGARRRLAGKRWLIPVNIAVIVALIAGAFFIGRGSSSSHAHSASSVPAGFVSTKNHKDGFSISYPKQWRVVTDPSVPLLLSAGGNDALSVQVLTLQKPVNSKNVSDIKAVTDAILSTPAAKLQVLLSRPITIAGISGYYYLYTFTSGNQVGVHAHYFLFQGRKLTMMVFQALPISDFQKLAPVFDEVSASFRSNPKILGPTPRPAKVAPTTTAPSTTAPGTTAPATTTGG